MSSVIQPLVNTAEFVALETKRKTSFAALAESKEEQAKPSPLRLPALVDVYLALEPKFLEVFQKFDVRKRGFMDRREFGVFQKEFTKSPIVQTAIANYERKIRQAKACFRADMEKTRLLWENFDVNLEDWRKEGDGQISWAKFWHYFSHKEVLKRVNEEGLGLTFVQIDSVGIKTCQSQYVDLKPYFIVLFKKYDLGSSEEPMGYIGKMDFVYLVRELTQRKQRLLSTVDFVEAVYGDKITWRDFWSLVGHTALIAINQAELDEAVTTLDFMGAMEDENGAGEVSTTFRDSYLESQVVPRAWGNGVLYVNE